jgi:MFS transporter, DHA3 family, tetracycline resistance protein
VPDDWRDIGVPLNAFRVHLFRTGFLSLAYSIIFTTWMVYQIQVIKLDALQLVLIGTMLEVSIFLFEIPTGVVADVYSRRLSVILGTFIMSGAFLILGVFPTFGAALFAQFLWGLGHTFTSGAYEAWMVDELGEEQSGKAFLRANQIGRAADLLGIILSAVLAVGVALNAPILVGSGLMFLSGIFLILVMPENGFKPTPAEDRSTWQKWTDTFRGGVRVIRSRPALINILGVGLFFGLFSEGWDRLWQKHLIDNITLPLLMTPVLWISLIRGVESVLGIGITELVERRLDTNNRVQMSRALFALTAFMVIAILVFGVTQSLPLALVAIYVFSLSRGLIGPIFATWTNQHIDSQVRATVLSMQSQTDAIGQIAGGPPIGALGQISLRAALIASGITLSPALLLLQRVQRTEKIIGGDVVEVAAEV